MRLLNEANSTISIKVINSVLALYVMMTIMQLLHVSTAALG